MQPSPPKGIWGRYALFIVLSFGILALHAYLTLVLRPPVDPDDPAKWPVVERPEWDAELGVLSDDAEESDEATDLEEPAESEVAEVVRPEAEVAEPIDVEPIDVEPATVAAEPLHPRDWVTLGSADPASPCRMLVTLATEGAAIARIELNSPRFRDMEVRSGYLGHVTMDQTVRGSGCPVQVVGHGTPAARAGLAPGDVITAVDDIPVTGYRSLSEALATTRPGQEVVISIRRGDAEAKLNATLGRRPIEVIRPEADDPLSCLLTLSQFDQQTLGKIVEEIRADGEEEEDRDSKAPRPRDPTLGLELDGLDLRTGNWEIVAEDRSETRVTFRRTLAGLGLEITKTYRLKGVPIEQQENADYPAYHLTFEVAISNIGDGPHNVAYQLDGPTGLPIEGDWYANKVGRGWGAAGLRDVAVAWNKDDPKLITCPTIAADEEILWKEDEEQSLAYLAVDAQYFSVALMPQKESPADIWLAKAMPLRVGAVDPKWKKKTNTSFRVVSTARTLQKGETLRHQYDLYAGPKKPKILEQYELDGLLYYGWFTVVAKPMLALLHIFHSMVFNYGLAIIMLTVLVRSCMFPLSRKMAINAQMMQKLQPEIKKLQEKYKTNLEARSKAQQELFKKHNYNPLSGCLVMFIQLPIFIGLYRGLMVDIELRGASLLSDSIRWCSNLAAPDMLYDWSQMMPPWFISGQGIFALGPYFNILPLVTIALFILQQKMFMPPPADEQAAMQQNMMKYMMIFFGLMFFKVASGLCLYFIASSAWGVAERKLLPKHDSAGPSPSEEPKVSPRKPPSTKTGSQKKKKGRGKR